MERIELLWDAWEDCLCKEQLRAEFDRLTTENEKWKATPVAKLYMEAVADRFELLGKLHQAQAQLAKICLPIKIYGDVGHIRRTVIPLLCEQCKDISAQTLERVLDYLALQKTNEQAARCEHSDDSGVSEPYHYSRDKAEYPWIRHEGKADGCPICNPKPSENKELHARVWASERSQPLERRCYVGGRWILLQDCRVCNPKPTQCPECKGAMVVEQMDACPRCKPTHFEYYWFQCPKCKGEGVVSRKRG